MYACMFVRDYLAEPILIWRHSALEEDFRDIIRLKIIEVCSLTRVLKSVLLVIALQYKDNVQ